MPGHFPDPVTLESVRPIGTGFECRARLGDGSPGETILSVEEADEIFGRVSEVPTKIDVIDAEKLRLLIESARVRLAYAHDPQFAVSLSGIKRPFRTR